MIEVRSPFTGEVIGTTALKASDGFSRVGPSVIVVIGYAIAFYFLALVLRTIPLGVTYAIWSGLGTALVAIIGMTWFQEPVTALKIGSTVLIVLGVIGLAMSARAA